MSKIMISTCITTALLLGGGTVGAGAAPTPAPSVDEVSAGSVEPMAICHQLIGPPEDEKNENEAVLATYLGYRSIAIVLEQGNYCRLVQKPEWDGGEWVGSGTTFDHDRLAELRSALSPSHQVVAEVTDGLQDNGVDAVYKGRLNGLAHGVRGPAVSTIKITTESGITVEAKSQGDIWLVNWRDKAGSEPDPEKAVLRAYDSNGVLLEASPLGELALPEDDG